MLTHYTIDHTAAWIDAGRGAALCPKCLKTPLTDSGFYKPMSPPLYILECEHCKVAYLSYSRPIEVKT